MKFPIIKTISWYCFHFVMVASLGTLITGEARVGLTLASAELLFETVLYFGHETVWEKVRKQWN